MSAQLDTAYAHLSEQGVKITARALRTEAGVSTAAAVEYLKAIRSAAPADAPELPADKLTAALGPLWAAAYAVAVEQLRDAHRVELDAYRDSERQSLEAVDHANADANRAETRVKELTTELEHATQDTQDLQKRLAATEAELKTERERATQAADRAARAEATAETLQNILNKPTP